MPNFRAPVCTRIFGSSSSTGLGIRVTSNFCTCLDDWSRQRRESHRWYSDLKASPNEQSRRPIWNSGYLTARQRFLSGFQTTISTESWSPPSHLGREMLLLSSRRLSKSRLEGSYSKTLSNLVAWL